MERVQKPGGGGARGSTGVREQAEEGDGALRGYGGLLRHPLGESRLPIHAILYESPPAQLPLYHSCSTPIPSLLSVQSNTAARSR